VKQRLQLSPALTAAILCALLWFAFWLIAFHPRPIRKITATVYPAAIFLPAGAEDIREIRSPTLFALPSEQGFSGTFPESHVNLKLSLDQPDQPKFYLPREPADRTPPTQISLLETVPPLQSQLPAPGATHTGSAPRPERIALFFSPSLQVRMPDPVELDLSGTLPPSVRIHLTIRPNGTVEQALFETPVENSTLAGAVRKLRFAPAAEQTSGWLDIRFTAGGDS